MKNTLSPNFLRSFLPVLLLFFLNSQVSANHIIGGDMYYDCIGFKDNDPRTNIRVYRVYLELYRDCQARNAAYFDFEAHMTIFRGNAAPYTQIKVENTGFTGPVDIDPPNYPCLTIPPNVCVHKALYVYDLELPISSESYHLVWQRCCRNQSISNIYSPGDAGSTFTIELTPLSQLRCNNSPRFNNFPPTVICVDEPFEFDHSATDPDGDNIVYEFCAPLIGGGNRFGGGQCDIPNPDPDCPPPFGTVTFRAPQYTANQPLGFDANTSLDQITGLLKGVPQRQGQFVVGVCMKEYRNGNLMSTIRRDFQFNVSTCTPNFSAVVRDDEKGPNGESIILSCNDVNVRFRNQSTGNIDSVLWAFDTGDSIIENRNWEPTVNFGAGGVYPGMLIINPNTPCTDTALLEVRVVEEIKADFVAEYDTCNAGPVDFTDYSNDIGSVIKSWKWDLGARQTDTVRNPTVEYEDPGAYLIKLQIEDEFGCRDTFQQVLTWQPAPRVIIVEPSVEEGCAPLEVSFKNLSYPVDDQYDVKWFYSDGAEASGLDATHVFQDTGVYSVRVEITSPIGCYVESNFDQVIAVYHPPIAGFTVDKEDVTIMAPDVMVSDTSLFGLGREWLFEDFAVYFDQNLTYAFQDTGLQMIRLISVDRFGCADTLVRFVDVAPVNTLFFPNAFTPNGDGDNDVFGPVGLLDGIRDFEMLIANRYGEIFFESDDVQNANWDGTVKGGKAAPNGVYVLQYRYQEPRGQEVKEKGFITLIR